MASALDALGQSAHLPTHALNRYGYEIQFDVRGHYGENRIDYDSLGAHIVAPDKAAKSHGVDIWLILCDSKFQPYLYKTRYGDYIRGDISISAKRP
jgi:penicillin-insensitive murein endopeptidase